jgi:hypothetical protein
MGRKYLHFDPPGYYYWAKEAGLRRPVATGAKLS